MEAGLDSLGAVELRNALGERFSVQLAATATFDHPSISALAAHILQLLPAEEAALPQGSAPASGLSLEQVRADVAAVVHSMLSPSISDDQVSLATPRMSSCQAACSCSSSLLAQHCSCIQQPLMQATD